MPAPRIASLSDAQLVALDAAAAAAIEDAAGVLSLSQIGEALDPSLTQQRMTQLFALPDAPNPTAYVGRRSTPVYSYAAVALWARRASPPRFLA